MRLFIEGVEHDATEQIEIFNHDKGFNVIIKYKDDLSDMRNYEAFFNTREGEEISLCNVTEFHHLYRPGHTAFESDIHWTGHTFNEQFLSAFESIFVVTADVVEEDFYSDWLTPDLN